MKKRFYLFLFAVALLAGCDPQPAIFEVATKNFPLNAVITIESPESGETFKVENISNTNQTFKVNIFKKGYAYLKVQQSTRRKSFWFYLDGGTYKCAIDANKINDYPFLNASSAEGKDIMAYYNLQAKMSQDISSKLDQAQLEFDSSSRDDVMEKAKNLNVMMEKKAKAELHIIKEFVKQHPASSFTPLLLEQLGRVESDTEDYVKIFNLLDEKVKISKNGKKLLEEILRANNMRVGRKMPAIEGQSPSGEDYDPKKVLKKVNLFICWTSYNGKSRFNNPKLVELYEQYKTGDVEFIGISYDKDKKWWVNVIRDDKLTWPQFSDLKGAKSPNASNLSNYNIPYFFVTDQQGKVLFNDDLTLDFISQTLNLALKSIK